MHPLSLRVATLFLTAPILGSLLSQPLAAQNGDATYQLTWTSTWSPQTHPTQFPSNPHYSELVGATHTSAHSFWAPGALATRGVQDVAEFGSSTRFRSEVAAAISQGTADQTLRLGSMSNSPRTQTVTFTASAEYPLLTLVTMVAPSPDWIIGIHDQPLMQNGNWVDTLTIPAEVYDAGTDSGISYNSGNQPTVPHAPIAGITTSAGPFQNDPTSLGTFTLTRLHSTAVYGCGTNPAGSMEVQGTPRLGQSITLMIDDPTQQLTGPALSGWALGAGADPAFPCGSPLPNFGLSAPGTAGELLVLAPYTIDLGPQWNGSAVSIPLTVPNQQSLVGLEFYIQGLLADTTRVGVTDAVALKIGS